MLRSTGELITFDKAAARASRLRRRVFKWVEVVEVLKVKERGLWAAMVTLTYKSMHDWRGNQIREFMLWVKKLAGCKLRAYAWVAELQKRGAIHYHVILVLSRGFRLPKPDRAGAWPYGMSRVEKARTFYYIAKYTSKGNDQDDNEYPRGARTFATWICGEAKELPQHLSYRRSVFPKWLREILDDSPDCETARRVVGGGWAIGDTCHKSPYVYLGLRAA